MSESRPSPGVSVLVLSGSSRRASLNGRLAELAARVAEQHGAHVDLAEAHSFDVPSFDGDDEAESGVPEGAAELRRRLLATDGFLLASPEYNASMPGALKNLIDWTSRFRPQPFDGRHALLMSASPSLAGGNRGLWALRMPLEHLGARVFPDMFSLAMAHKAFETDGSLVNVELRERFDTTIQAFLSLAEAAKHYACVKRAWVEFLGEPPGEGLDRVDPAA
jgi:chromate reductase, NAD(P)H dehydrogenase (quinone)